MLQGSAPLARVSSPSPVTPASGHERQRPLGRVVGSVAVVVLVDLHPHARWWGWMRLALGARALGRVPGLGFAKVLGSGAGGGFGLQASGTHRGLFLVFDDEAHARQFITASPVLGEWRRHARECCVALLRACASKGSWDGARMSVTAEPPDTGPILALTRAAILARHAWSFWRLAPPAEVALKTAAGCVMAIGLGEAPVLRQATFSLWQNAAAMDAYARSGAHQQAIRTAYAGGYFKESMFLRFVPLAIDGTWQGVRHG
jgi:spheroidene monooxygenase